MTRATADQLALFAPLPGAPVLEQTTPEPSPPRSARAARRPQLWLALHFPAWPLGAVLGGQSPARRTALAAIPWAVVESDRQRHLVACNAVAHELGLRAGHSLNAAIALCAEAIFLPRDEAGERDQLQAAAHHCLRYTSTVSIEAPDELLLEVRGSLRLFGGAAALIERVQRDFAARGITTHLALTTTATGALWLARLAREPRIVRAGELTRALGALPITQLRWPEDIELRLRRFGVRRVADLLRLPRAGLARRLGKERLTQLDQATGRTPTVRTTIRPKERYHDRVLLDFEIETTTLLAPLLYRRLDQLQHYLRRHNQAIDTLQITLCHRDAPPTGIGVQLAAPTADARHLATLLHEQLARIALPAPVREVRLHVRRLLPAPAVTHSLLANASSNSMLTVPERQARLLEQLTQRLGPRAIVGIEARADHQPDRAQHLRAPLETDAATAVTLPDALPRRPLWLLREPQCLREPPTLLRGPETLETGGWDTAPIQRAYYVARTPHNALAWVYRDLTRSGRWFLHGLFG